MRCLQEPLINGDFDENGEKGEHSESREILAQSPFSPLRVFVDILGARKAQENPRSFISYQKTTVYSSSENCCYTYLIFLV